MFDDNEFPDLEVSYPEKDPIYTNADGLKFFNKCDYGDMRVEVGDIVRIRLESTSRDGNGEVHKDGFGQILALFEDEDEETFVEVRWLEVEENLPFLRKKRKLGIRSNELFETDDVDDVPVGSVLSPIHLISDADDVGCMGAMDQVNEEEERNTYLCRYSVRGKTLFAVTPEFILERGLQYSEYNVAYAAQRAERGTVTGAAGRTNRRRFTVDSMQEVDLDTGLLARADGNAGGSSDGTGEVESAGDMSWYEKHTLAMRRLHLSVLPKTLPCRETETAAILEVIRETIVQSSQKFVYYISGMPGTGKTATVLSCIDTLEDEAAQGKVPAFEFLEINCLRLHTPSDAYVQLWKHLSPKGDKQNVSSGTALKKLDAYFDGAHHTVFSTSKELQERKVTILLIDEMDYLSVSGTHAGTVLYNFCNWPLKVNSKLFVIGISNTIDLLERQMNRNQSRQPQGKNTRMVFAPYNHTQMTQILHSRLLEFASSVMDDKSIEYVARKAAMAGGDVRRALRICQRVIEMIRDHTFKFPPKEGGVRYIHQINAACAEYQESPTVSTMKGACDLDKAILCVFFRHINASSGVDELSKSLNGYELYLRLGRLVTDIEMRQKSPAVREKISAGGGGLGELIQLVFPPWNILRTAVDRLIAHGLLKKVQNSAHSLIVHKEDLNGHCLLQSTVIGLVVDIADIKVAFKFSGFGFYVDPQ